MNFIYTLQELISALENCSNEEYPTVLKNLQLPYNELTPYESWKSKGYTRNCIVRTSKYELVLLCWNVNDATPIHDHDGQKCWVYQVKGSISEKRFDFKNENLVETLCTNLSPGKLTYMDDKMGFHVLVNNSNDRATTLHLYMNPIDFCSYFCEEEKVFKKKTLQYDTVTAQKEVTL
ncbi:MAG: cysteine dioxygenase family protein [Flavobacteriaceae bacterium]|nr:cysteine dioxygenase family protein [Flavobacteriaceae bacterium]